MRDTILGFGEQLAKSASSAKPFPSSFERVFCCGMGGSSVAGELLSIVRPDTVVHWDWEIPASATPRDIVVCTSWSGETAETISSYDTACSAGIPVAVITTGGILAKKAQEDRVPLALLPNTGTPPRFNVGAMTGALFELVGMSDKLPKINSAEHEQVGKKLADSIGTKIPIFYAAYPWRKIAGFFKTTVNENAKRHSWTGSIPSAEHNEIMGWVGDDKSRIAPIVIRDSNERARDIADLDALVAFFGQMGYTAPIVDLVGAETLERALNAYVTALWASCVMADAAGIDAVSTEWIDKFKSLKIK